MGVIIDSRWGSSSCGCSWYRGLMRGAEEEEEEEEETCVSTTVARRVVRSGVKRDASPVRHVFVSGVVSLRVPAAAETVRRQGVALIRFFAEGHVNSRSLFVLFGPRHKATVVAVTH